MNNKIIEILKQGKDEMSFNQVLAKLNIITKDSYEFDIKLKELQENNDIAISLNRVIYNLNSDKFYIGTLSVNKKGFGFVTNIKKPTEESFFVPPTALNKSISEDTVVYKLFFEKDGRKRAEIVNIVKREKINLIGEIRKSYDGQYLDFNPMEQSFSNYRIYMLNKQDFSIVENLIVKVKIVEVKDRKLFVKIIKILGDANKAADRISSIAEEFEIRSTFSQKVLDNAKEVSVLIENEKEELKKREKTSLLDKTIVTIDGEDSKDLDDAISVEKLSNGNFKLIVAIADVSHYVKPKTPLDNEALARGNSTYLANTVIPMLPKILSNDLCSLNPNTLKLALVCEMEFDKSGNMITKKVYESIIKTTNRLTYNEVNDFFVTKKWDKSQEVSSMMEIAFELYKLIDEVKIKRGTINFGVREAKVIMDENSNVVAIKARTTGESEKLIEQFMVSANEAVAELIFDKKLPFIYRNHGNPLEDDLITWYKILKSFGINPKLTPLEMLNPKNINKTLDMIKEQAKDEIEAELLNLTLLRYMDKAKYGLENIGHFGLSSPCYTHFTSPIRRYSDLIVHRYLKQYIIQKDLSEESLKRNSEFIEKASTIINKTEIVSVSCEREVIKACMVEYMSDKVNNIYDGTISIALKFGIFIQLDNMVEGLVHISNMDKDIVYDEVNQQLIGRNNKIYRMGQKVKIKVLAADIRKRTIDFILV